VFGKGNAGEKRCGLGHYEADGCGHRHELNSIFSSLSASLNSGNLATSCLQRLAGLQKGSTVFAAAAAWVLAVGSTWGMAADDAWHIIVDMSVGSSGGGGGEKISPQLLPEFVGLWTYSMSSSLLCDGPDAAADFALANR
jgi:hypothetical protein